MFGRLLLMQSKCARLMISYYQNMKQQYRVDRMLQKVQQELDTNVPVFEGTDLEAGRFNQPQECLPWY